MKKYSIFHFKSFGVEFSYSAIYNFFLNFAIECSYFRLLEIDEKAQSTVVVKLKLS